jgi:type VI secretion system protein ImpK
VIIKSFQAKPVPEVIERAESTPAIRLVDCFIELIVYTDYWLAHLSYNQPTFDEINKVYSRLIDRAQNKCREAGFSAKDWETGFFAVCTWIDESLLCSAWDDRRKWESAKLQRIYFDTGNAGEEFFKRLEQTPEGADPVREVYEFCLALDFKGKYFGPGDQERLQQIRQSNLKQMSADFSEGFPSVLFPRAYVLQPAPPKRWPLGVDWRQLLILAIPVGFFIFLFFFYEQLLDKMILK